MAQPAATAELEGRRIGRATVLFGPQRGKYPDGNSVLVEGSDRTLLIDPSLGVLPRRDQLPRVDLVVNSHCHEDHIAGNHLFPDATWHLHELDLPGIRSLDAMMAIYGYSPAVSPGWRETVRDRFHFCARDDAVAYVDGEVFELGETRVRVIHAPGHTRGHCLLHIEPEDVLFLADMDLSSFGPFYGDAWSDLEDFECSLARVREIDAAHYATFHHIGVLDGREAFLERFDRFAAVIHTRERRLLEDLKEPHTLDEIAETRFVYRPGDRVANARDVEKRSMGLHIERLRQEGRVREVEPGLYLAP